MLSIAIWIDSKSILRRQDPSEIEAVFLTEDIRRTL